MKKNRYDTSHLPESQFEPGSNDQALKNKLGIMSADEMDRREKEEQLRAICELSERFGSSGDYGPMAKVFQEVIRRTLRAREPR